MTNDGTSTESAALNRSLAEGFAEAGLEYGGMALSATSFFAAQATGDPHLRNIHGQAFDLMQPGKYTLLAIPRSAREQDRLLWIEAAASRSGERCGDVFFNELNVTGAWAEAEHSGGLRFHADVGGGAKDSKWIVVGGVDLKVVHGETPAGVRYLNLYVRHLGSSGLALGGLLGEDDHEWAATPDEACRSRVSLRAHAGDLSAAL